MICRDLNIGRALRARQRGFLLNPFRFGGGGGSGDPHFDNVSLLLHMDGADGSTAFVDSSTNGLTPTVNGSAQIDTAQSKFGGASMLLDGSADWIYYANFAGFELPGDFTVECFVLWSAITNGGIFHLYPGTPPEVTTGLALGYNGDEFAFYCGGAPNFRTFALTAGRWYHVALVRAAGSISMYVDGAKLGDSVTDATNYASSGMNVGIYYSSSFALNGHIDEFRLTKGVARYTANFTPPTAAFPNS